MTQLIRMVRGIRAHCGVFMTKMMCRVNGLRLHRLHMVLVPIMIVGVITGGTYAKKGIATNDTLLTTIKEKSIGDMTDGEFRYFFEYQKDIDDFNPCDDKFLKEVAQKEVKEMTQNEFEYFDEFILDCDNVDPCFITTVPANKR